MTLQNRMLIVFDGNYWFIRYVRVIEHDLEKDEKVYRCDAPLGGMHRTLDDAVAALRAAHQVD